MSTSLFDIPELLLDAQADLGEGPTWDARNARLGWVDIHAGRLHIYNPVDGFDQSFEFGQSLGCAAPRRSGGWVLGLQSGFGLINPDDLYVEKPTVQMITNPEPDRPGNRFNDGKCDPAGRFLAGSMDDAELEASGCLYSLSQDGMVKTLVKGTRISNGMAWSPDQRYFYYIDTPTRKIVSYDYALATGEISNPTTAISIPAGMGWPDGMTSDNDGMLWVALWAGAKLTRWDPKTGQLLAEIPIPALNVSACVFGGAGLSDLFVTTARKDMQPEQLARYPQSGGLFRIHTQLSGMPTFEFGG